jgi:hypothetical protein
LQINTGIQQPREGVGLFAIGILMGVVARNYKAQPPQPFSMKKAPTHSCGGIFQTFLLRWPVILLECIWASFHELNEVFSRSAEWRRVNEISLRNEGN